jgi:hypothetical protein
MPPPSRPLFPGIILIVLGVILLLPQFTELRGRDLWPIFVLGTGVAFSIAFAVNRANYGLLMPATIATVYGLMFFYCVFEGWYMMRTLWPVFLIGPGLGFLLMYFLGKREQGLLIPAGILLGLGSIFLLDATEYHSLWPVLLIVAGLAIIFGARRSTPTS